MVQAIAKAGLRLLVLALQGLPAVALPWMAASCELMARPFRPRDLRRLHQNIQRIWGLPPASYFGGLFARQVSRLQILVALETIKAIYRPASLVVSGLNEFKEKVAVAEAARLGHIIVTAHLGSWELCAYYGAVATGRTFHVLAKPARYQALTAVLDDLRRRMRVKVFWTGKKSIVRDMLSAIRNADAVGFVMDQKPEGRKGPMVRFLGQPTEFVSGPASLASKTKCAVIALFCVREGPMRYRLLSEEIVPAGHDSADLEQLTQKMAAAIEKAIRLYPEQWTWNYKRWR